MFKYDLIEWIMKGTNTLQRFTFIPMLTEYEPKRRDGNRRNFASAKEDNRPGTRNEMLIKFLIQYKKVEAYKRDFREIAKYFKLNDIETVIYNGQTDKYFANGCRDEYFKIPKEYLYKSLVFVDPDIGLKVKNLTKKHLHFEEAKCLYDDMDENSILMIYQHFPRERHEKYLCERAKKLEVITEDLPIYVSDNEIIFFLFTKTEAMRDNLAKIITNYKEYYKNYENLMIGNVNSRCS